jgi:flagellar hook protein FlgE
MINGESFFVVEDGGAEYYTKAGNFTTDGNGNLVTGSGNYVMGYTAAKDDETGDYYLQKDRLRPISLYGSEYMNTEPAQTTQARITGNVNAQDDAFKTSGSGFTSTKLYVYDSLGNKYGVQFDVSQISSTQYTLTPSTVYLGSQELDDVSAVFSGDGVNADGTITLQFDGTEGTIINENSSFILNITDGSQNLDAFAQDITVDFSEMTCYGSSTNFVSNAGTAEGAGAGKEVGEMISLGISSDGSVVASYTNGDTVTIGQLVTAKFSNASGLEKLGDNLFGQTLNSGDVILETIDAAGETMSSGVVEMSNVDLATEFTDMIVTQRGFQANSRVITTSDTMIEELLSLKR